MPLVIRDVDEEVYTKFKAKAALKGLKIGEAITDAMSKWINEKDSANSIQVKQNINNSTYRKIIRGLIPKFSGKWGVITNGELLGIYNTKDEALKAIKSLGPEPNLLFLISKPKSRTVRLGIRRITDD